MKIKKFIFILVALTSTLVGACAKQQNHSAFKQDLDHKPTISSDHDTEDEISLDDFTSKPLYQTSTEIANDDRENHFVQSPDGQYKVFLRNFKIENSKASFNTDSSRMKFSGTADFQSFRGLQTYNFDLRGKITKGHAFLFPLIDSGNDQPKIYAIVFCNHVDQGSNAKCDSFFVDVYFKFSQFKNELFEQQMSDCQSGDCLSYRDDGNQKLAKHDRPPETRRPRASSPPQPPASNSSKGAPPADSQSKNNPVAVPILAPNNPTTKQTLPSAPPNADQTATHVVNKPDNAPSSEQNGNTSAQPKTEPETQPAYENTAGIDETGDDDFDKDFVPGGFGGFNQPQNVSILFQIPDRKDKIDLPEPEIPQQHLSLEFPFNVDYPLPRSQQQVEGTLVSGHLLNATELNEPAAHEVQSFYIDDDTKGLINNKKKKNYGTFYAVDFIHKLADFSFSLTKFQLRINDISSEHGGSLEYHEGHRLGLDADIDYKNYRVKQEINDEQKWIIFQAVAQSPLVNQILVSPEVKDAVMTIAEARKDQDFKTKEAIRKLHPMCKHLTHFHINFTCAYNHTCDQNELFLPRRYALDEADTHASLKILAARCKAGSSPAKT